MNSKFISQIRPLIIAANILFVLWIVFNGIDSGFQGTIFEKLSFISLIVLLLLNSYILVKKKSD